MNEKLQEWIEALEIEWAKPDGFLGKTREGVFDRTQETVFLVVLESIKLTDRETVDRRLVALFWYIPTFLR